MLQPMSAVPASQISSLDHALFGGSLRDLYATAREALHTVGPIEVLDAAVLSWLARRGHGGTTGANALRTACAARSLAARRPGEDARAAAVSALGFLHFAAGQAPGRRSLPDASALTDWSGWGEDALLYAALDAREGGPPPLDSELCRKALEGLIVDPRLRSVRGVLLAWSVGGRSAAATRRVLDFLDVQASAIDLDEAPASGAGVEAALARACRLDPRPTLGHALQLASAVDALSHRLPRLAPIAGSALLASAATWPALERHWRAFLRSSSA